MKNKTQKRVYIFLAILLIFTVTVNWGASLIKSPNLVSLLIMWTPGLAAISASLLTKRSLKLIGWSLSAKWMALGWVLPVAYAFVAYGAVWLLGLGDVPNPVFLERARITMGMNSDSDALIIVSAFFFITVLNLLPAMLLALGEEIGWRGFLVPELTDWVGLRNAGWISGIVWATWHLPGILSGSYSQNGTPLWYQIICFSILVISTAVLLAWLRMKSRSIWPAAIFHATHNGVIQMFFNAITRDTGHTSYFTGEFGIALVPVLLFMATYIYRKMDKLPTPLNEA